MFGNPRIVRILKKFVKDNFPQLVFLIETKCNKHKMEYIHKSLQFDNYFTVENIGASGGLALLWIRMFHYKSYHSTDGISM